MNLFIIIFVLSIVIMFIESIYFKYKYNSIINDNIILRDKCLKTELLLGENFKKIHEMENKCFKYKDALESILNNTRDELLINFIKSRIKEK